MPSYDPNNIFAKIIRGELHEGEQLRQEIFRSYLLQGTYRLERGEGK